jgi:5-methyltetrahydropteroyltriglutamate--homocysteine methyltransferase
VQSRLAPGTLPLLPTTLVGSYPQPDWLIDRERLAAHTPPRVRMRELWRIPAQIDFYLTSAELALDCAAAVNQEIRDLTAG